MPQDRANDRSMLPIGQLERGAQSKRARALTSHFVEFSKVNDLLPRARRGIRFSSCPSTILCSIALAVLAPVLSASRTRTVRPSPVDRRAPCGDWSTGRNAAIASRAVLRGLHVKRCQRPRRLLPVAAMSRPCKLRFKTSDGDPSSDGYPSFALNDRPQFSWLVSGDQACRAWSGSTPRHGRRRDVCGT
jgi:hypothetical protein